MGRTPCCDKNGLKRGPWTSEEDQKLMDYIQKHGHGSWRTLPKNAGLSRCGKSCRLRWTNYLRPDIKRGRFSFEEEETIIQLHSILGNKWSAIAARLPGRTDNEIKNYWNTHIRKRLLRMGIDPVTHTPRLDLLDLSSLLNPSLYNPNQLDVSRFLGVEPVVNSELLRLATNLLSAQHRHNTDLLRQSLQQEQQQQQQQFPHNPQIQEPFPPSFQSQDLLQNPVLEIPTCTTSDTPFLDEAQLVQANVVQFQSNAQTNPWQNSGLPCEFSEIYAHPPDCGYYCSDQSIVTDPVSGNSDFVDPNGSQDYFNFPSVLSTPASSPTPLNSSSTYINSSTTEDERDSNCSDVLDLQFPDLLDVGGFI